MAQPVLDVQPPATALGVHVFDTGRLSANATFLRGEGLAALARRPRPIEFPVLAYVIEHPEGLVLVDTGLGTHVTAPRRLRGFPPAPLAATELAPQLRAAGLHPGDVQRIVLTHLDWDHTGGLGGFPHAESLVHEREWRFARTRLGAARYRPHLWPSGFAPTTYRLDDGPWGPFPQSRALTAAGDLRLVPLPGHSPGQVAVVHDVAGHRLLFAADHALRADWLVEDLAAGREVMLGAFGKRQARATSRRLAQVLRDRPTVLLPAHDAGAPRRLAALEPTLLPPG